MKIKQAFKIGDFVEVAAKAISQHEEAGSRWKRTYISKPLESPFVGQIVGAVYRQEGDYCSASGGGSDDGYSDFNSAHFECTKTVLLWQVRQGVTNKPVDVFEKDLKAAVGCAEGIPWRAGNHCKFDEKDKEWFRGQAAMRKRDAKGHFLKA